jgi:hypothetical protein
MTILREQDFAIPRSQAIVIARYFGGIVLQSYDTAMLLNSDISISCHRDVGIPEQYDIVMSSNIKPPIW